MGMVIRSIGSSRPKVQGSLNEHVLRILTERCTISCATWLATVGKQIELSVTGSCLFDPNCAIFAESIPGIRSETYWLVRSR